MNWSEYQKKAADFFSSIGLKTEIEFKVQGVRGVHVIDVYASGTYCGIQFNWVVECKSWKNNIPKEKVMALYSIVQDVGADRGFLLSEVGFQSGALLAARSSNITLTSIGDLSNSTEAISIDALIGRKYWELQKARTRLLELKGMSEAHEYNAERLTLSGDLSVLELLLEDAHKDKYPILYPMKGIQFSSLEQLAIYADSIIERANTWDLTNRS